MQEQADRILESLDRHGRSWVMGTLGDDRWELARLVQQQHENSHLIQLPSMDESDSAVHGLLQAAAVLGQKALGEAALDSRSLHARARQVAEALAHEQRTLLIHLPGSWTFNSRVNDAVGLMLLRRGLELLGGLAAAQGLKLVMFTGPLSSTRVPPFLSSLPSSARFTLSPRQVSRDALEDARVWGASSEAASVLREVMSPRLEVTSLQLRLMVALVHLGDEPASLLQQVVASRKTGPPAALDALEPRLEVAFRRPGNEAVRTGLHRILQSRFPLPLEEAWKVTGFSVENLSLLSHCIGPGSDEVRVDEAVRRKLLKATEGDWRPAEPDAHLELASFHQARDGAVSVEQAHGGQVLHWLEKVHHLGHSGELGAERWDALHLTAREFYWDRARSLSIEHKDYMGATAVYQRCLDQVDSEDAYSWHYLGFNLDRAAEQRERAEAAFRKAVELDPTNPWWNGRLVTFLIEQSRFRAADKEWHEAQARVDPDGTQIRQGPSLALHLHRWVTEKWLERGEVGRARDVFNAIPLRLLDRKESLKTLRQRLEDAEEVRLLGEPVYPASFPVQLRWKRPQYLEPSNARGSRLKEWFPGRVLQATPHEVRVVVATPEVSPTERQVVVKELTREQWHRASESIALPRADTFIEVGMYEDELLRIVLVPNEEALLQSRPWLDKQALRYLRRWA